MDEDSVWEEIGYQKNTNPNPCPTSPTRNESATSISSRRYRSLAERDDWDKVKIELRIDGSQKVYAWKFAKPLIATGAAKLIE